MIRHGSQIPPQLSAASPTNRPQPKVIMTIKLQLCLAAGCDAKDVAELYKLPCRSFCITCHMPPSQPLRYVLGSVPSLDSTHAMRRRSSLLGLKIPLCSIRFTVVVVTWVPLVPGSLVRSCWQPTWLTQVTNSMNATAETVRVHIIQFGVLGKVSLVIIMLTSFGG